MRRHDTEPKERTIMAHHTTDKFFEFRNRHTYEQNIYYNHYRVWRADYFQPSGDPITFHWEKSAARIGKLMGKRDPKSVRTFAEILWWKQHHDLGGSAVLAPPVVKETPTAVNVWMPPAYMEFGDFGMKDRAHVQLFTLSADNKTGALTYGIETTKIVEGNQHGPSIIMDEK
jgi:hypothetical protein